MNELWSHLRRQKKPILLYGMGNGADKILDQCSARGIAVSGVFASDAFVRGQDFRGFRVMTYAQAKEQYGEMIVLVAFATALPEVLANIDRIAAEQELYVPDVPVYGEELFDAAFVHAHWDDLKQVRDRLADAESHAIWDGVIESKLTGSYCRLMEAVSPDPDGLSSLLHPQSYRLTADLGAFTGDTASRLASFAPAIEKIICFEPDPKTFQRLTRNLGTEAWAELYPFAAWDKKETLTFHTGGSRSSRLSGEGKTVPVQAMPLDAVLRGRKCDFIKFDVEGADLPALLGAAQTISVHRPELLLSLYHRSGDLFTLPQALMKICPTYRLYLRRAHSLPAWDLNLIALSR